MTVFVYCVCMYEMERLSIVLVKGDGDGNQMWLFFVSVIGVLVGPAWT